MIRKLRKKFIAAAMLSTFIVLAVLMSAINLYNYHSIIRDADQTLSVLSSNQGRFPEWMSRMDEPEDDDLDDPDGEPRWFAPGGDPRDNGFVQRRPDFSPELAFESRFFSVTLRENGDVDHLDLENIAAVNAEEAADMAQSILSAGKTAGFSRQYRYAVTSTESGTRVTFLDCTRGLSTFRGFLWTSVTVSAVGLAAVFGLMILLSGRFTRPVAESYEKQKQFITDAGHEIKTPLTIIDADADVLAMDLPEENEWLTDIRSQTKRLTELTNDLIFLSKMDEERLRLQSIEFPFSDMVTETAQSFRSRAVSQNKEFSVSAEPMITVCGDEKSLRQLVNILLDNALKYSPPGGKIALSLEKLGRQLRLSVSNTCDSIPEGDLDTLFDRFYRSDKSRNSQTGGHGLGLSIARAVATAHKGKITASAPDEKTMCFTVLLPLE